MVEVNGALTNVGDEAALTDQRFVDFSARPISDIIEKLTKQNDSITQAFRYALQEFTYQENNLPTTSLQETITQDPVLSTLITTLMLRKHEFVLPDSTQNTETVYYSAFTACVLAKIYDQTQSYLQESTENTTLAQILSETVFIFTLGTDSHDRMARTFEYLAQQLGTTIITVGANLPQDAENSDTTVNMETANLVAKAVKNGVLPHGGYAISDGRILKRMVSKEDPSPYPPIKEKGTFSAKWSLSKEELEYLLQNAQESNVVLPPTPANHEFINLLNTETNRFIFAANLSKAIIQNVIDATGHGGLSAINWRINNLVRNDLLEKHGPEVIITNFWGEGNISSEAIAVIENIINQYKTIEKEITIVLVSSATRNPMCEGDYYLYVVNALKKEKGGIHVAIDVAQTDIVDASRIINATYPGQAQKFSQLLTDWEKHLLIIGTRNQLV